ncbi:putative alpha beta-hydrolase [Lyophyllum shimeji]|uniref:Alpha beta-hydrolase n=1 Tax=Lyophyllum shimeji TaxID=47721 RepID=A0A9P3UMK5_LYOSH|nr:putative alpha beta-hydrolase [Lyophyllum shimeji]
MLRSITSLPRGYAHLPEAQRRMYEMEREDNFRWASQLFARLAPDPLMSTDVVDTALQDELSDIGQFAEVAHGSMDPEFVWKYMMQLSAPGYPLHGYSALLGSELLFSLHGSVADLQGYVAYRPEQKQLVVAFSGTSSAAQAWRDFDARLVPHPCGGGRLVHSGFWNLFSGVRIDALSAMRKAWDEYDVQEVVFTGHSMGGVMGYLLAFDILEERASSSQLENVTSAPRQIKVVAFGSPRIGNSAFVQRWRELVQHFGVVEYSVRTYNDGVPALLPRRMGYRHSAERPLYLAHGRLWRIPPAQSEYSLFSLTSSSQNLGDERFPLGGHNYYNGRDMELLQRRMQWFKPYTDEWDSLQRRFEAKLLEEKRTMG